MDIETYKTAAELHRKFKICEELYSKLSDGGGVKDLKTKDKLAAFVNEYMYDFMQFLHGKMTETCEAFKALHCCPPSVPDKPSNPDCSCGDQDFVSNEDIDGAIKDLFS